MAVDHDFTPGPTDRCSLCGKLGLHECLEQARLDFVAATREDFWKRAVIAFIEVCGINAAAAIPAADEVLAAWDARFNPPRRKP